MSQPLPRAFKLLGRIFALLSLTPLTISYSYAKLEEEEWKKTEQR